MHSMISLLTPSSVNLEPASTYEEIALLEGNDKLKYLYLTCILIANLTRGKINMHSLAYFLMTHTVHSKSICIKQCKVPIHQVCRYNN